MDEEKREEEARLQREEEERRREEFVAAIERKQELLKVEAAEAKRKAKALSDAKREARRVKSAKLAADGLSAQIVLSELKRGHVHEFDLGLLRNRDQEQLLHRHAYYTVNEVPKGK